MRIAINSERVLESLAIMTQPAFGRLPDLPATTVWSFLPPTAIPVSKQDLEAKRAAATLFSQPELCSFPTTSFLGRLVCEQRSYEGSDRQCVQAIWKKAVLDIQRGSWMLTSEDWALMELPPSGWHKNCSYDQLNTLGERMVRKSERILESAFQAYFNEDSELHRYFAEKGVFDVTNLRDADIPESVPKGEYIREWVLSAHMSKVPLPRTLELNHHSLPGTTAISTIREAKALLIGIALRKAWKDRHSVPKMRAILEHAHSIHSDLIKEVFKRAVEQNHVEVINLFLEWPDLPYLPMPLSTLASAWRHAERTGNGGILARIQKIYPKDLHRIQEGARPLRRVYQHPEYYDISNGGCD